MTRENVEMVSEDYEPEPCFYCKGPSVGYDDGRPICARCYRQPLPSDNPRVTAEHRRKMQQIK